MVVKKTRSNLRSKGISSHFSWTRVISTVSGRQDARRGSVRGK
jgi:hypothetical protein